MGIRFFCPKGHKLNVKTELAGKIGICPKCGERMLIPLISTRRSGESKGTPQVEHVSEAPVPNSQPDRPDTTGTPEGYPTFAGQNGTPGSEWENDQTTQTSAIPLVDTSEPQTPFFEQNASHSFGQPASAEPVAYPAEEAVASVPESTSLLNDPSYLWYVRTSDNQTYGPAASPVIQNWIQEKRIGPHMLVWREGWTSWLEAGNVFPELEAVFTSPALDTFPSAPVETEADSAFVVSASPNDGKKAARRKKAKRDLLIVVSLIVVIMALIAGLIFVLVLQYRSVNTTGETASISAMMEGKSNFFSENRLG